MEPEVDLFKDITLCKRKEARMREREKKKKLKGIRMLKYIYILPKRNQKLYPDLYKYLYSHICKAGRTPVSVSEYTTPILSEGFYEAINQGTWHGATRCGSRWPASVPYSCLPLPLPLGPFFRS